MTAEHHEEEQALVVVPQTAAVALWGTDEPWGMTQRMSQIADAMAGAVRDRGMTQLIGPRGGEKREYVKVEGWSMVGAMVGVFPRTVALDEIREEGTLVGFRAEVELVSRDGGVVGGAIALCTIGEELWATREWNQIASMAQTRAIAKAYRQTLGFIMPMAGYSATPAEEMDGVHDERRPAETRRSGGKPPQEPEFDWWAYVADHAREWAITSADIADFLGCDIRRIRAEGHAWLVANGGLNERTAIALLEAISSADGPEDMDDFIEGAFTETGDDE